MIHVWGMFSITTFITISPTVVNIPHSTQDILHGTEHTLYGADTVERYIHSN